MKNQKEDRRIRRTQKMLKESLAELMRVKDFKDISVKDITDRADLNRGTFYLHYTDTYDLLKKMELDILQDFQDMIDNYGRDFRLDTLLPILGPVIDYITENAEICKILFENTASNDFVNQFHMLIYKNGISFIEKLYPEADKIISGYFFEFITYGLTGILKQWIDKGMVEPKEKLAEISNKMVIAAAHSLFNL